MPSPGHLILAIVVCLLPLPVDAQSPSPARRVFVDAAVGPDWDDAYSDSVPGVTLGSGFAFGFDSGRSGVEVAVDVPQWHAKNLAPGRYQYAGPSYGWLQQGHTYESAGTVRRRSVGVIVLHRANLPINRRITFSGLVGGGYVYRPVQFSSVTREVLPDGQVIEANANTSTALRNYLAAAGRFDVEFRVAPHLSVVPRVRLMAFPSLIDDSGLAPRPITARPEIAVRWVF